MRFNHFLYGSCDNEENWLDLLAELNIFIRNFGEISDYDCHRIQVTNMTAALPELLIM